MLLMLFGVLVALVVGGCVGWAMADPLIRTTMDRWTSVVIIALTCVAGFLVGMMCTAPVAGG